MPPVDTWRATLISPAFTPFLAAFALALAIASVIFLSVTLTDAFPLLSTVAVLWAAPVTA